MVETTETATVSSWLAASPAVTVSFQPIYWPMAVSPPEAAASPIKLTRKGSVLPSSCPKIGKGSFLPVAG